MHEMPQSGDARCPGVVLLHGIAPSHTGLPRHAGAIKQAIAFLRDGRFQPG
jgi:hypothetical protein